jgi:hypothetical protein
MGYVGITLAGIMKSLIMKSKEQDRALQAPAEANRDKHINYLAEEDAETGADAGAQESTESRQRRHDADSGNDGSSNEMLQKEMRIDPGNEHHRRTDADDKIFDDDIDRSPKYDADAGGDGTGTTGPEPDEG